MKPLGDGDYAGALELTCEEGVTGAQPQADLDRLTEADLPAGIFFNPGAVRTGP